MSKLEESQTERHFRVHDTTRWNTRLAVTTNGENLIAHAGAAALRLTADRAGLTKALSDTLHRDDFTPDHDRGRVLVDAAVMMADGGNTLCAIDVLRHQETYSARWPPRPPCAAPCARSTPPAWKTLTPPAPECVPGCGVSLSPATAGSPSRGAHR
ncbi:hypothetical protein AB0F68_07340 [Micromonospora sp. NPDC023966]|uniref:hypothetical protein n=1 Tax=Micromonospora sp. NPDC023966 TaxID=3154699 RepID=UPI0033EFC157